MEIGKFSPATWFRPQADDRAIKAEGLDALSESELREACRARGIRANVFGEGASKLMRKRLSEWLELSLNRCTDPLGKCCEVVGSG